MKIISRECNRENAVENHKKINFLLCQSIKYVTKNTNFRDLILNKYINKGHKFPQEYLLMIYLFHILL